MQAVDLILKKRNGGRLSRSELEFLIQGYVGGEIPAYQMAAWSMAVYFQGMDPEETADLTLIMADSGQKIDLSAIRGIKVDKHSTGGVADTTSLVLVPLVASCGVPVAKISGRGLGHTGGTVDKLESIPGYRVELGPEAFAEQVNSLGVGLVGQTSELAPADKLLYALRDVTATVDSIPLISSSIMSKKLASGADCLVLDVKTGTGAFMQSLEEAEELAKTMVQIGMLTKRNTSALITDMNQPLGNSIGNSLEVQEAILVLSGQGPEDLTELSLELAAEMLLLARFCSEKREARRILASKLQDKQALQKFAALISAQKGDAAVIQDFSLLPQARIQKELKARQAGFIQDVHPLKLGLAAMELGAGRATAESSIDPAVGVQLKRRRGDQIRQGETLAVVHANDRGLLASALEKCAQAFTIGEARPRPRPLIYGRITAKDV